MRGQSVEHAATYDDEVKGLFCDSFEIETTLFGTEPCRIHPGFPLRATTGQRLAESSARVE